MPVDIKYLKSRGVSSQAYKQIFSLNAAERTPQVNKLITLISDRIRAGRNQTVADFRIYKAIDLAWKTPFNQTTQTMVQHVLSKRLNAEQTVAELKSWGVDLEELFLKVDQGGSTKMVLNPPIFFNVLIPLVRSYVTIRAAKLFNDRNQTPLFQFPPNKPLPENQVMCEIVEDLVETVSAAYGYAAVLRSAILHTLKYGMALSFPREEWHVDEQEAPAEDGSVSTITTKEGLRYILPHPTRRYHDLQYPATSINTDTGMEFGGHWRLMRYGDILVNPLYWNRRAIGFGDRWYDSADWKQYFTEVYPCAMRFPRFDPGDTREDRAQSYSDNEADDAVFVVDHFQKINPRRWGLADYDHDVWHRFTVANDDTIIFAGPCAYNPMWTMGYDYDEMEGRQTSFALECIPWQDHLGNLLTQMVLTAKQNLANVIYYDTNLVDPNEVRKLQNMGEQKFRAMNFLPFDSFKLNRAGINPTQAFHRVDFGWKDTSQLSMALSTALNIMERVLQMSAQEVGAAAQHYQSAKEISVTQSATTSVLIL